MILLRHPGSRRMAAIRIAWEALKGAGVLKGITANVKKGGRGATQLPTR